MSKIEAKSLILKFREGNIQMMSPCAGVWPSTFPPLSAALLVMALEMGCKPCEYEKLPLG